LGGNKVPEENMGGGNRGAALTKGRIQKRQPETQIKETICRRTRKLRQKRGGFRWEYVKLGKKNQQTTLRGKEGVQGPKNPRKAP